MCVCVCRYLFRVISESLEKMVGTQKRMWSYEEEEEEEEKEEKNEKTK